MDETDAPDRDEGNPTEETPDRDVETTEPSKGAGRKDDVQRRPEDQRGRPDPKERDSMSGG